MNITSAAMKVRDVFLDFWNKTLTKSEKLSDFPKEITVESIFLVMKRTNNW